MDQKLTRLKTLKKDLEKEKRSNYYTISSLPGTPVGSSTPLKPQRSVSRGHQKSEPMAQPISSSSKLKKRITTTDEQPAKRKNSGVSHNLQTISLDHNPLPVTHNDETTVQEVKANIQPSTMLEHKQSQMAGPTTLKM